MHYRFVCLALAVLVTGCDLASSPREGSKAGSSGEAALEKSADDFICDTEVLLAEKATAGELAGRAFARPNLWPCGVVPYELDLVRPINEANMERHIDAWRQRTNLTFVRRTDEKEYLIFSRRGTCSVNGIGFSKGKPLTLNLGRCGAGGVQHEIGHALGLYHEHTRTDRDDHIIVHWDQIKSGAKGQFNKRNGTMLGPIDWESIMLYSRGAFACCGKSTMSPVDPTVKWARNTSISQGDADGINMLYKDEICRCRGKEDPMCGPPPPPPSKDVIEFHDRFEARVKWTTETGSGSGLVGPKPSEVSGVFTFFNPETWEQIVSVHDGRKINGHWWVTVASSTDQAWKLEISDTESDQVWETRNLAGQRSAAVVDIEAFQDSPADPVPDS